MLKHKPGYSWNPDRGRQSVRILDPDYREIAVLPTDSDPARLAESALSGFVCLGYDRGVYWWSKHDHDTFEDRVYTTSEHLAVEDVDALVVVGEQRRSAELARARALASMTQASPHEEGSSWDLGDDARTPVRRKIPNAVKIFVWQRDGGRCVDCGSNSDLEFDHIIPLSMGGSDTERNLQLLCGGCNKRKGGNLV